MLKRKSAILFSALCTSVYFVGYLTRYDLAVSLTEIAQSMKIPYRTIALAVTGICITYGIGQVLSGMLGDRISPHVLISVGLGGTVLCNGLVAVTQDVTPIIVIWWVNGFFQSLLWPPMVRALAEHLTPNQYRSAVLSVSVGGNAATVLIYIIAPLCIRISGWRLTFMLCAAAAAIVLVLWGIGAKFFLRDKISPDNENISKQKTERKSDTFSAPFSVISLVIIFFVIILQGMLRDGVQTWAPVYIASQFQLDASSAILSGIVLPIFSVFSLFLATRLSNRVPQELLSTAICFAVGAFCAAMLRFLPRSVPISLLGMAGLCGAMHGVNFILTTRIPAHYCATGHVSAISGALNAATYVGSAASTYGIALISEQFGWDVTIGVWLLISVAGLIGCLFAQRTRN